MALPREAREVSDFNDLEKGLGENHPIDLQDVSEGPPKPFRDGSPPQETEDAINGQPLTIDYLQELSPDEREVVRQSDEAFIQVRQTWAGWKTVGAGLVVLRNLAMRETGSNNIMSKRYKNRFHELLEQRAYRSESMSDTTRKALLKCAELSPELDEWYDHLDEDRRLRLNHPERVLRAFRASQKRKPASRQSRRAHYEAELEKVQQDAGAAVSSRDAQIEEQQQQIGRLTKQADSAMGKDTEGGIQSIVQYVVTKCETEQKIREVIFGLNGLLGAAAVMSDQTFSIPHGKSLTKGSAEIYRGHGPRSATRSRRGDRKC